MSWEHVCRNTLIYRRVVQWIAIGKEGLIVLTRFGTTERRSKSIAEQIEFCKQLWDAFDPGRQGYKWNGSVWGSTLSVWDGAGKLRTP